MKKYPIRKRYANMVTFEVYEGNLTRKAWKRIKERMASRQNGNGF